MAFFTSLHQHVAFCFHQNDNETFIFQGAKIPFYLWKYYARNSQIWPLKILFVKKESLTFPTGKRLHLLNMELH